MSTATITSTAGDDAAELAEYAPTLAPVFKTLCTVDGHCCSTFRVAAGGVHECDDGRYGLLDDVANAAERAQLYISQQGGR